MFDEIQETQWHSGQLVQEKGWNCHQKRDASVFKLTSLSVYIGVHVRF